MVASGKQKPAIFVCYTKQASDEVLKNILHGIEEEGIPVELKGIPEGNLIKAAYTAACQSPLSVGITCNRESAVLHYKHLQESSPLFHYSSIYSQSSATLRNLGTNAARLVKGLPFK